MFGNPREESSTFLRHIPCPRCGSSDANSLFSDGHTYCYSCNTYSRAEGDATVEEPKTRVIQKMKDTIPFSQLNFSALRARHINEDTCKKFSYMLGTVNGKPCQVANYYNDKGELTGQKLRFPDKTFAVRGHITDSLYGQHLWSGGKKLIITEGEIDCLSVSQIQNNQYPVVSVPNGAQGAKKVLEKNLEYLAKFDEVILMFDMDDAGRKAIEECAKILPVGKAFIANLPCKDPNDCLKEGKTKELISAIWNAKPYRPDGIVAGTELENKCVHELLNITDCVQLSLIHI
jgi:twinkle protein